jgi:hypothetical protein
MVDQDPPTAALLAFRRGGTGAVQADQRKGPVVIALASSSRPIGPASKREWWRANQPADPTSGALNACPSLPQSAHAGGLGFYFKSNPGVPSRPLDLLYRCQRPEA